jgi:glycosyltransferase involved in cell wall biosynthesis
MARILLTTFTFWPNMDGVARASLSAARALVKAGHDVTVATGDVHAPSPVGEGFRVVRFDVRGIRGGESPIGGKDVEAYGRFVTGEPWAVVVCEGWAVWPTALAEDVFPSLSARKVLVSHGAPGPMWVPKRRPFWGLGPVCRSCLLLSGLRRRVGLYDRLVFLGRSGQWSAYADARMAFRRVPGRCRIIPNAIDAAEFEKHRGKFRQQRGIGTRFLAVTVANFSATKNQCRTADVFTRAQLDGAVLCLIGGSDTDYAERIAALAERDHHGMGPDGLRVLVNQPRECVCAAIADADVCLLTSRKETQSIFLLEGMAVGVPFVSTPTGCASEWPGGLTARSSTGLVRALRLIAGDERLRRELGAAGRTFVRENHRPEIAEARWAGLIDELCHGGSGPTMPGAWRS